VTTIVHVTPITPNAVFDSLGGRAMMVRWQRPDQLDRVLSQASMVVGENGAYGLFKAGVEMRTWNPYYEWLEPWLFHPGRWAIIPDVIGEGSQAQDALLRDWPFGHKGAPVFHTDEPIARLQRLTDEHPRVCIGATGDEWQIWKPGRPGKELTVEFRRRIEEIRDVICRHQHVPPIHGLRMVGVAALYPELFDTADASSLGQNGWRHRKKPLPLFPDACGVNDYADKMERRART
jgi:hypothetical protein